MKNTFDVIIIGAGSVGVPLSLSLSEAGLKVLVIDAKASVGQGSNKAAIGGIRATHSNLAKMYLCQESISVFSEWEEKYGDPIDWEQGGYVFLAYSQKEKESLQKIVCDQKEKGQNISYLNKDDLLEIVPDLNPINLYGGTFSPEDGYASPLLAIHSMYKHTRKQGGIFLFGESVTNCIRQGNRIIGVRTDKGTYFANTVVNAAGAWAKMIFPELDLQLPVEPESHEAGITEPIKKFVGPLIVDMRVKPNSTSFYFTQHATGQILFCLTPNPPVREFAWESTSSFLPQSAERFLEIMPRVSNVRVRRIWRGLYPVTPDGSPIIGESYILDGYFLAVGMCGQGFMLGPGIAKILTRLITKETCQTDNEILSLLSIHRAFMHQETLK